MLLVLIARMGWSDLDQQSSEEVQLDLSLA